MPSSPTARCVASPGSVAAGGRIPTPSPRCSSPTSGLPSGWDSAIVLYPSDGTPELSPAWGYTWGEVGSLGGIGVSSIVSGDWPRWPSMTDPEHGFVHEWLHQVEAVYRRLGDPGG